MESPAASDRRSALLAVKLRAIVRDHLGRDLAGEQPVVGPGFGRGAGLVVDDVAWVLLDANPERGLGGALAWALRQPSTEQVCVVADAGTGVLARRAALFDVPITVWGLVERVLVPAIAEAYPSEYDPRPEHLAFVELIEACGAQPCIEYGVVTGEVRGLEVCRVVDDPGSGQARLEVGVGAHDRDAFLTMHANRATDEALRSVVASVAQQRVAGAPLHPLNRLAAERFLRWQLLYRPEFVGARWLQAVAATMPRPNVKDHIPAVALGEADDGEPVVVVCSTGVDLDLVPAAADARALHAPTARLVLAMPARDVLPVTRALATRLVGGNCDIIAVDDVP